MQNLSMNKEITNGFSVTDGFSKIQPSIWLDTNLSCLGPCVAFFPLETLFFPTCMRVFFFLGLTYAAFRCNSRLAFLGFAALQTLSLQLLLIEVAVFERWCPLTEESDPFLRYLFEPWLEFLCKVELWLHEDWSLGLVTILLGKRFALESSKTALRGLFCIFPFGLDFSGDPMSISRTMHLRFDVLFSKTELFGRWLVFTDKAFSLLVLALVST